MNISVENLVVDIGASRVNNFFFSGQPCSNRGFSGATGLVAVVVLL